MQFIHLDPEIKKRIKVLRRSGKKTAKAAEKVEGIISDLLEGGRIAVDPKRIATKHGELRIDNCIKYNLGSGYRLITIKRGNHLFLTFIGSHDDCDQWIENNRHFQTDQAINRSETTAVFKKEPDDGFEEEVEDEFDSHNEEPFDEEIDEKILRRIFAGLTGGKI